jgi:hypothetical protein
LDRKTAVTDAIPDLSSATQTIVPTPPDPTTNTLRFGILVSGMVDCFNGVFPRMAWCKSYATTQQ